MARNPQLEHLDPEILRYILSALLDAEESDERDVAMAAIESELQERSDEIGRRTEQREIDLADESYRRDLMGYSESYYPDDDY